jgi:uncharacterized protein DUF6852/uncharacterized protein DUF5606
MEYSKLVAVTGLPGLFELINSKNDGAIVRSLEDNSTKFASSRIHNFSHLESIEIYTIRDNVNLVDIFQAMEKAGGTLPDGKDNAALKKYFEKVYPDMDFERVYASDLKKMVKWFDVLKKNNVEIKLSDPVEEEEEPEVAVEDAPAKEEKSAKKAAKKKEEEEAPKAEAKAPAKKEEAPKIEAKAPAKKEEAPKAEAKAPAKKKAAKKAEEPAETKTPAKKKAAPKKK